MNKYGESFGALISADRVGHGHQIRREHNHLLLLEDVRRGLADIAAGRTEDADAAIARLQQGRKSALWDTKTAKRRG